MQASRYMMATEGSLARYVIELSTEQGQHEQEGGPLPKTSSDQHNQL